MNQRLDESEQASAATRERGAGRRMDGGRWGGREREMERRRGGKRQSFMEASPQGEMGRAEHRPVAMCHHVSPRVHLNVDSKNKDPV